MIDMADSTENTKTKTPLSFNQKLANGIAIVVVSVWAVSMLVDMIPQAHYDPPIAIYPALMLVLGGIFGLRIVKGGEGE